MLPALVRRTIETTGMLHREHRILVGVSGGADSLCLLLVLRELGYNLTACHLNHGLRGDDADADEAFVKAVCEQSGTAFYSRRVDLRDGTGNLEEQGRLARKAFFSDLVREIGFDRIALAHNRNDRVETFLLNLFRGAGPDGLTSMEAVSGAIVRPLIDVPRAEIERYLSGRRQPWRNDATNLDREFARNRMRHEVIPALTESFNSRLTETLARTISILEGENIFLDGRADEWLARNGTKRGDQFVLKASELSSIEVALQRRVLRKALIQVGDPGARLKDVGFEHLEAARALLGEGRSGKRIEVPCNFVVMRSFDQVIVRNRTESPPEFDYELQIPGEIHIPELGRKFRAQVVTEGDLNRGLDRVFVDGNRLGPRVRIRNWKPGDYYKPVGLPSGKLKKLFQQARIPRNERHRWPIFVADSTIIWVASFPVSRDFAFRGCSQRIVALEALPVAGNDIC